MLFGLFLLELFVPLLLQLFVPLLSQDAFAPLLHQPDASSFLLQPVSELPFKRQVVCFHLDPMWKNLVCTDGLSQI